VVLGPIAFIVGLVVVIIQVTRRSAIVESNENSWGAKLLSLGVALLVCGLLWTIMAFVRFRFLTREGQSVDPSQPGSDSPIPEPPRTN